MHFFDAYLLLRVILKGRRKSRSIDCFRSCTKLAHIQNCLDSPRTENDQDTRFSSCWKCLSTFSNNAQSLQGLNFKA